MEKFIGGLRWGNSFWNDRGIYGNATFPFATLEIMDDKCILSWTFWWIKSTKYILPFNDINYITIRCFLCNKGIQFIHKNKSVPNYLLFWTFHPNRVSYALKSHGIVLREYKH